MTPKEVTCNLIFDTPRAEPPNNTKMMKNRTSKQGLHRSTGTAISFLLKHSSQLASVLLFMIVARELTSTTTTDWRELITLPATTDGGHSDDKDSRKEIINNDDNDSYHAWFQEQSLTVDIDAPTSIASSVESTRSSDGPSFSNLKNTCFIHVGKTAGTTLECIFGKPKVGRCRPGSPNWKRFSAARTTTSLAGNVQNGGYVHVSNHDCRSMPDSFLISTRNPLSRFNSWFAFEKSQHRQHRAGNAQSINRERVWGGQYLFDQCFNDTLEAFVMNGLGPYSMQLLPSSSSLSSSSRRPYDDNDIIPADVSNMTCPQRALAAVVGARTFMTDGYGHNWYNYEYYHDLIHRLNGENRTLNLIALRSEYLAEDWDAINAMMNDNDGYDGTVANTKVADGEDVQTLGKELFDVRMRSTGGGHDAKDALSPAAAELLCQALCVDIQYYVRLLSLAANVDDGQLRRSTDEVREWCPGMALDGDVGECPRIPSFPRLPLPEDYLSYPFIGEGKPRFMCDRAYGNENIGGNHGTMPACREEDLNARVFRSDVPSKYSAISDRTPPSPGASPVSSEA